MAREVLKCPNCAAPLGAPDTATGLVTCRYCTRVVDTGIRVPAHAAPAPAPAPPPPTVAAAPPAPAAAPPPAPAAKAPAPAPAKVPAPAPAKAPAPAAAKVPAMKGGGPAARAGGGKAAPEEGARFRGAPAAAAGGLAARFRSGGAAPEEPEETEEDDGAALTDEAVLRLAKRTLKTFDSLYFHPGVPEGKEGNARKAHGRALPRNEEVLVLFDDTLFGGADDGFVITAKRICWKNMLEDPQMLEWADIDPDEVGFGEGDDEGSIFLGEAKIHLTSADVEPLNERLRELVTELASQAYEG